MGAIRYIGRNRNAGYGYPLWLRLRREIAFRLAESAGWQPGLRTWLGYRIDFNRDRYLEEYWAGDPPEEAWVQGVDDLEGELLELVVERVDG